MSINNIFIIAAAAITAAFGILAGVSACKANNAQKAAENAQNAADLALDELEAAQAQMRQLNAKFDEYNAALIRAQNDTQAAGAAHNDRLQAIDKTDDADSNNWLNTPIPDGLRGLFCASAENAGIYNDSAAGGTFDAVCKTDDTSD